MLSRTLVTTARFGVLLALLAPTSADPDLWGHVRLGLDGQHEFDPYSFTSDQPIINYEWLSEAVMAAAYQIGGAAGLVVLKVAVLALALSLVFANLSRLPPVAAHLWVLTALVGSLSLFRTVRPQIFSYLGFALLLWLLARADRTGRPSLLALPSLFALWANLHGGVTVGLGTLALWSGIRLLTGPARGRWFVVGLASLGATLLNPWGYELLWFLFIVIRPRPDIQDWQPLWTFGFGMWVPWLLTAGLTIWCVWKGAWTPLRLAITVLWLVGALFVVRLAPFPALSLAMLLAPLVQLREPQPLRMRPRLAVALVAAIVLVSSVFTVRAMSCLPVPASIDREGAAFLQASQASGRLLSWFDWGQYAIWHLPRLKVSYDGRRETVYSTRTRLLHDQIYRNAPDALEQVAGLKPDHVWLPRTLPIIPTLRDAGWREVFSSAQGIVFSRVDLSAKASALSPCFP